jgi:UDP-N-acetylglucosamine 2-epimerase
MNIVSIVGARPEFVQAWPVSRALHGRHCEILVHTGQHYDYLMSQAFFDDLGLVTIEGGAAVIYAPQMNLEVGSGLHGAQTGAMLSRLEQVLLDERPDLVLVRGDTNSTLAGALAAAKLHIPVAHIEAGERSYDRNMPEEINRVLTDRLAGLHFCASHAAVGRLAAEGITTSVHFTGDVMLDALLVAAERARRCSRYPARLGLVPGGYTLVTIHRAANTDNLDRLENILNALNQAGEPVVFPVHPRTCRPLELLAARRGVCPGAHIRCIEPVGYLDMLALEQSARLITTDSGGVQREAYYLGIPCLTLRGETEWVETVEAGWNQLVDADPGRILAAWRSFRPPAVRPPIYGDGRAGERIVEIIEQVYGPAGARLKALT